MLGGWALMGLLLLGDPGLSSHILVGVVLPDKEFQITVNGDHLLGPPHLSDSSGSLAFTIVADCPCTVLVRVVSVARPSVFCGEAPR